MNLTQCPYDGAPLDVEISARGWLLLICGVCDAAWETHGGWVGRLRQPDADKLIAERRRADFAARTATTDAPLPMTPSEHARRHDVPTS